MSGSRDHDTGVGKLFPLWDPGGAEWHPLGLPMAQNRIAVPTWSYAFERVPPARIIEIGTFAGGFALALGVHAWTLGVPLHTYDIAQPNETIAPKARLFGVVFHVADVFLPVTQTEIAQLIRSPGMTYVLCDGGNKSKELDVFGPFLKPGDVIAAHDYCASGRWPYGSSTIDVPGADQPWPWCETKLEDGQRVAAVCGLTPFMQEYFDLAGWLAYRKPGA
jgi:hypothetical protein